MTQYCKICHDGVIKDGVCLKCGAADERDLQTVLSELKESETHEKVQQEKLPSELDEKLDSIVHYLHTIRGILVFFLIMYILGILIVLIEVFRTF